jgi:hypothetical protein
VAPDHPRLAWVLGPAEWRTPPDWSPEDVLTRQEREAAARFAREALSLVPGWHYVRDILLPQIRQARERR